ncbi:hypothetical protein [Polymorphobacter megasporae]|uniref:hypothetical protein n=1 Tax=Glacieibacterium megasporae TaxID=2835787 RepID=UPI001C1DDED4|nr:hypothetical protein [Polymorphobacter megasporae]UAJ12613.1 hypothetical protein KTC28_18800 [Polymorphobacter megasporae]
MKRVLQRLGSEQIYAVPELGEVGEVRFCTRKRLAAAIAHDILGHPCGWVRTRSCKAPISPRQVACERRQPELPGFPMIKDGCEDTLVRRGPARSNCQFIKRFGIPTQNAKALKRSMEAVQLSAITDIVQAGRLTSLSPNQRMDQLCRQGKSQLDLGQVRTGDKFA